MKWKSETCFSKNSDRALTSYDNEYEAQQGADYANATHGNDLVVYKCRKCKYLHLSPKNRQTTSETCNYCKDRNGKNKELYKNRTDAENRANILKNEIGIYLDLYQCPHYVGWHLTKG